MKTAGKFRKHPIAAGVALAIALAHGPVFAQDDETDAAATPEDEESIEEVVVLGRFISGSQQLVNERMNDAFATDLLGAETISRLGDSTVGSALATCPGPDARPGSLRLYSRPRRALHDDAPERRANPVTRPHAQRRAPGYLPGHGRRSTQGPEILLARPASQLRRRHGRYSHEVDSRRLHAEARSRHAVQHRDAEPGLQLPGRWRRLAGHRRRHPRALAGTALER